MIAEGALVIYKNKPVIVKERADGKYTIAFQYDTQAKVRDKDIELLHPGPIKDFSEIEGNYVPESAVREAWELLADEGSPLSLKDLAIFIYNEYTPFSAYASYLLLCDGLYFNGTIESITLRTKEDAAAGETKRALLQRETEERAQFLERLKAVLKDPSQNLPLDDARFIQDVEALAYGKTEKSRTMKELKLGETPEDAHLLLLKTGFWTGMNNPHPGRFGLSLSGASVCPDKLPDNDSSVSPPRSDLCHLVSYAIDSSWSNDPDDAVSIELVTGENGSTLHVLYVHVADPASLIGFDSPAEKEARNRGVTLYLPERTVRMLSEECMSLFTLGVNEKSFALTFKITIDDGGAVIDTQVFPSIVKVRRMTYEEADNFMESAASQDSQALCSLFDLSQKIFNRRTMQGAVNIELPDVHIIVENNNVNIEPVFESRSASMIKEFMIVAGEGAGTWAASRGLAFPYISQEVELQGKVLGGFAGSMQLRRCMRPRMLSVKPGRHQGLGLDIYTQVTSPLRRYTDLLAHIQIRKFLNADKPLSADDISMRLGFSEAAAIASVHAERASVNHWKMVYLSEKKDSLWDAIAIENKHNNRADSNWIVLIPSLALETQIMLESVRQKDVLPNDKIKLVLKSVNIPKCEAVFLQYHD